MSRSLAGVIGAAPPGRCAALLHTMLERMRHDAGWTCETVSAPELGLHVGCVLENGASPSLRGAPDEPARPVLLLTGEVRLPDGAGEGGNDDDGRNLEGLLGRYRSVGASFVQDLNGLFAGVLVDRSAGLALLFNDRYGAQRIYWHREGGLTFFASEAKALLAVLPHLRAFDDAGLRDFLRYGSTLEGRTLFRGISTLPGATLWRIRGAEGRVESSRYFDSRLWEAQLPLCPDGFMQEFSSTFRRILPAYLTSASQIGISITGGLDTRMIMACLPAGRVPSISYTYAGEAGETLDCRIGARVASLRGMRHCVLRIGHDFLRDYRSHLDRTVFLTDGAAGALQAHEIYFSALARQLAPIRLTGNFGSEVLRGMSTFKPMELDPELVDPPFRAAPNGAASAEAPPTAHPVTHAVFQEIPWHLFGTVAAVRTHLTFRTPYLDNELVQLAYRAPPELRRSSAPALRLLRDNDPRLCSIPTDRGVSERPGRLRSLARRSAAEVTFKLDYLHKEGLPGWLTPFDAALGALSGVGLLGWHKFLPYRGWFRRELADSIASVTDDASRGGLAFLNRRYLASMVPAHVQGRRNHLRAIHTVATLEAVDRLLLRDSGFGPGTNRHA